MPGSRASVFGEVDDFRSALTLDGIAEVVVTGCGQFRARATQIALDRVRMAAIDEWLPRIASVVVPREERVE